MRKIALKTFASIMLACTIAFAGVPLMPLSVPVQAHAASKSWKTAYKNVLKNWRTIESVAGYSGDYLKRYFGSSYKYDKYFLCDMDGNGVPELFLYSTTMNLATVFTCVNGSLVYLSCDQYYKINTSKHLLVVNGHWHGAGGSGAYEYSIYRVKRKSCAKLYYIDMMPGGTSYEVRNEKTGGTFHKKAKYRSVYKKYVSKGKLFAKVKKYKLSNKKGLKETVK